MRMHTEKIIQWVRCTQKNLDLVSSELGKYSCIQQNTASLQ